MARKESLKRISEVVNVLVKQGLGYFVQEYGLKWHLPFHKKIQKYKKENSIPIRLRKSMEELGGAYVKLGQVLSLRPDLVPQEYCDEFKKLLDNVAPFSYERAEKIIETELNAPIKSIFKEFDKKPIGSASVSQAHIARLKNGKKVVVKIQRPGIRSQFESDIAIMHYLARKIEVHLKNQISPIAIVQEFEKYTRNELNFLSEAKNISKFNDIFKNSKNVVIPHVYMQHTTDKVLVMDYIQGVKLSELNDAVSKKFRNEIAKNIADAAFKQILDEGFFHADLHPGNILVLPGRSIALLDFGIVGSLDRELKRNALDMVMAIVDKDAKTAVKTLLKVGTPTAETDLESFHIEIETILHKWHGADLKDSKVTHMLHQMFNSCIRNKIRMPADLILLGKAMVTMEATCMQLNSDFNFVEYMAPPVAKALKKENKPLTLIKRFISRTKDVSDVLYDLPEETLELVEKLKREPIKLDLDDSDIWHLGREIDHTGNRLSYAIIIAALVVSGAMLVHINPLIAGYSIFSILAILLAGILMLILASSIMREKFLPYGPGKK